MSSNSTRKNSWRVEVEEEATEREDDETVLWIWQRGVIISFIFAPVFLTWVLIFESISVPGSVIDGAHLDETFLFGVSV